MAVADLVRDTVPVVAVGERLACARAVAPCEREGDAVGPSVVRGDSLTHALARSLGVPVVSESELRLPACSEGYLLEIRPPVFGEGEEEGSVRLVESCSTSGGGAYDLHFRELRYRTERVGGRWILTDVLDLELGGGTYVPSS